MKIKKNLVKLSALIPAIFLAGCGLIYNIFHPKEPEPIVPSTNTPPSFDFSANPESGYFPLTINLALNNLIDKEGDAIVEYGFEFDAGDDGVIDKKIQQTTSATETYTQSGKNRIYGYAKDARGERNRRGIEILVLEPSQNKLPTAELLINNSNSNFSGILPVTVEIKFNDGRDEDGTVIGYKLKINLQDSVSDEKEETIYSDCPIEIMRTYNDSCNVRVLGTVIDNDGGETVKSLELNVLERDELTANATLAPVYRVGDFFNFSGEVQNVTEEDITIENSPSKRSLKYRLIKDDRTLVLEKEFAEQFLVRLHKLGKLKLDYQEDEVTFTLFNAYIDSPLFRGDILPSIFPEGFSISVPNLGETIKESGIHNLEARTRYSMGSSEYSAKFTFQKFTVEP